jgi:hypothetical protein
VAAAQRPYDKADGEARRAPRDHPTEPFILFILFIQFILSSVLRFF